MSAAAPRSAWASIGRTSVRLRPSWHRTSPTRRRRDTEMGSVFNKRGSLWIAYKDTDGRRRWQPSGFKPGQEAEAQELLEEIENRIRAEREAGVTAATGPMTLRMYAATWI